ncbi:hypothetical protein F5146DRAFT_997852 [Armillaria mellea]|nr:hypothetical protein F5146DRAFT_997852 [Armillaria mellea]
MSSSSSHCFGKVNFKKTANGYQHTYLLDGEVDYAKLKIFPSDADLTEAYHITVEENETLWILLGFHPSIIQNAPMPLLESLPVASDPLPEINEEDLDSISDQSILEGLQAAIDSINNAVNLTLGEENELEALTFAAVALSLEKLTKIGKDLSGCSMLDNSTLESENESLSSIGNPPSLVEITPSELEGLKQCPNTRPDDIPKELSQEKQLAHQINSIIHKVQDYGTSTGLNQKACWTGDTSPSVPSTMAGNTANAEVAAKEHASESNIKSSSLVMEAGVSKLNPLHNSAFGFVISGQNIYLARVSEDAAKTTKDQLEISLPALTVFKELSDEKEKLVEAVAWLNTVCGRGNIVEMEEDKEEDD